MPTKEVQISVENLSVIYNQGQDNEVRSLENINVKINKQEYVIIFGPSGCGKSTLLYSISGLQKPTKGTVKFDSQDIFQYKKKEMVNFHQYTIGMIFQAFYLIPSLSIIDNVCLPKTAAGFKRGERMKKAEELLERFGILPQAKKMPSELSGGQKQRVSIARSLVNNPSIILADEPVGNLDSKSSRNVMKILQDLNEKDKKTIILVTHDPSHLAYGDKILHIKDGRLIKEEIVTKKKRPGDEEKEGEGEAKTEIKEVVPNDLRMLTKAFRNLSEAQVGNLLVPFKAQQLLFHILFSMNDEQMNRTKKTLEEFLYGHFSFEDFFDSLDKSIEDEGAGWDKRKALKFSTQVNKSVKISKQIDFNDYEKTVSALSKYLLKEFLVKLKPEQKERFNKLIAMRLKNEISFKDFNQGVDMSFKKGGVGVDKRNAAKLTKELEILLLMRYGE